VRYDVAWSRTTDVRGAVHIARDCGAAIASAHCLTFLPWLISIRDGGPCLRMSFGMAKLPKAGADGWYLLHEGQRHGPFPISAFIKAVEEGTITKDHLIWRPGWEDWRSGSAAAELLSGLPGAAPSAQEATPVDQTELALPAAAALELPPPPPPPPKSASVPTSPPPQLAAQGVPSRLEELARAEPAELEQAQEPELADHPSSDANDLSWVGGLKFLKEDTAEESLETPLEFPTRHSFAMRPGLSKRNWTNVALGIVAICFSAFALRTALQSSGAQSGLVIVGAWAVFSVAVLAIIFWQLAGVWRSAAEQEERAGSAFFTRAVQALVVVGASAAIIIGAADSSILGGSESLAAGTPTDKVRDALTKAPVYATLQHLNPAAFDSITEQVAAESQHGASEDFIFVKARSALGQTIKQYTPLASEDAILDMTEVMVAYMSALQATDPESCVAINDLSSGARLRTNLVKQFPDIFDRELAVDQRILTTADVAQPIPTEPQIEPQLNLIQTQMTLRFDQQIRLLAKKDLAPTEYAAYCQVALALLQEIRRLPRQQAADLLRYVYAQSG
jgi:hypothetical protein